MDPSHPAIVAGLPRDRRHSRQTALNRRSVLRLAGVGAGTMLLAACNNDPKWHSIDITGSLSPLSFTMTRAEDGKEVTAADYKGKIVLLYFGYTYCPDVCPTTLLNTDRILKNLGPLADKVRVLFVTVDPNRDTPKVLAQYVSAFAPQTVGLRGTPDQLAGLAKRCRAVYSVRPGKGEDYVVTHSAGIYVYDASGALRLFVSGMASDQPPVDGTTADLRRLIHEEEPPGLLERLMRLV
jgi:protein SCO1/2